MLQFQEKKNGTPLPEVFKTKKFRSYVDMANFADEHHLPSGKYFIFNNTGANLFTRYRELTFDGSRFHVEGRGNI